MCIDSNSRVFNSGGLVDIYAMGSGAKPSRLRVAADDSKDPEIKFEQDDPHVNYGLFGWC